MDQASKQQTLYYYIVEFSPCSPHNNLLYLQVDSQVRQQRWDQYASSSQERLEAIHSAARPRQAQRREQEYDDQREQEDDDQREQEDDDQREQENNVQREQEDDDQREQEDDDQREQVDDDQR
ncbi:hypothetical protein FHG87_021635 [Trinorchestia longiramus]|nr:hypothetical protein FHG87_021635 [Trinorchestia longiramus]